MFQKLNEDIERENAQLESELGADRKPGPASSGRGSNYVSDQELFRRMGVSESREVN